MPRHDRPGFYDPATRTFRPFCLQTGLALAAGPVVGALLALIMAIFP